MAVLNLRPLLGGLLLRGSQPFDMDSWATSEFLRTNNIQSVVDLRVEYERALIPWHLPGSGSEQPGQLELPVDPALPGGLDHGFELIENPLDPLTATSSLSLHTAEELGELYLGWARARPDWVASSLRPVAHGRRTLVHCSLGKDRTGVIAAVGLLTAGAGRAAIVADYTATTAELPEMLELMAAAWRQALPSLTAEAFSPDLMLLQSPNRAIEYFLDSFSREFGDAAGYLRDGGLSGVEVDALRSAGTGA
ncbi:tyrosine-protein phosphatase [Arthrobacter sp. M4]|uniref:tyrosine-protein phosphatase n=1 Tax=Arthrobacter sp. M4 TaxID=218160 RepID=UPI001CDB90ED|nr:tyrosine-protein phosphatase [Arthrobacter sp. M4]MCA4134290.1 tyrosine-protein phosphatase [Arthrobacter sp. M4]